MFTKKANTDKLDQVIDKVCSEMNEYTIDSDEFAKAISHVDALTKIKETNSKKKVDANTKAIILGNLAGIIVIVSYEHAHVLTSKALSFAGKLR